MALKIKGRREGPTGGNTHYKLSNGKIVPRTEAVKLQKKGLLPDYQKIKVNGKEYLRDKPDSSKRDNIDEQPLI